MADKTDTTHDFDAREQKRLHDMLMRLSEKSGAADSEKIMALGQIESILGKRGLTFETLAEHPDWLTGAASAQFEDVLKKLEAALNANTDFAAQNEAIRRENEAVRKENAKLRRPPLRERFAKAVSNAGEHMSPILKGTLEIASMTFRTASYCAAGPAAFGLRHAIFGRTRGFRGYFTTADGSSAAALGYIGASFLCAAFWTSAYITEYTIKFDNALKERAEAALAVAPPCQNNFDQMGDVDYQCASVILPGPHKSPNFGIKWVDGPLKVERAIGVRREAVMNESGIPGTMECTQEKIQILAPNYEEGSDKFALSGIRFKTHDAWQKPVQCSFKPN